MDGTRRDVHYEVRPLSKRLKGGMAAIYIDGKRVWIVHRRIYSTTEAARPDPKVHFDPGTGLVRAAHHDDHFFCADCPPDTIAPRVPRKELCPPGQRCFKSGGYP
jgi:hypothetical protein